MREFIILVAVGDNVDLTDREQDIENALNYDIFAGREAVTVLEVEEQ